MKKDEWIDKVKNNVLCSTFGYARYIKRMEKITQLGMKNFLTSLSLDWNKFQILRDESDEPIYTSRDKKIGYVL